MYCNDCSCPISSCECSPFGGRAYLRTPLPNQWRTRGFVSQDDHDKLLAKVNMTSATKKMRLENWKIYDGSKAGLMEVVRLNSAQE